MATASPSGSCGVTPLHPQLATVSVYGLVVLGDLLLTKPDQGETQNNQDELSPQKTENSD